MQHRVYVYRKQGSYGRTMWWEARCEDCDFNDGPHYVELNAEAAARKHQRCA